MLILTDAQDDVPAIPSGLADVSDVIVEPPRYVERQAAST
jgi:hypothetical protein